MQVIWNSLLPHSGGVNHNKDGAVRVVQFLGCERPPTPLPLLASSFTYLICQRLTSGPFHRADGLAPEDQSEESRAGRIEFWRDGVIGNGNRHEMPNEPGCVELTPIGRKIAQIDPWEPEEQARL